MHQPLPRWFKVSFVLMAGILFLLGTYQIIFNSAYFQHLLLRTLNDRLKIEMKWDKMHFNGMTGHFSGENLELFIPKSNANIALSRFKVAFSPFRLLAKQVRIINLTADELHIAVGETAPVVTEKKQRSPGENLKRLTNLFSIDRADISHITLNLGTAKHLAINQLRLNSQRPLLFYKKALSAQADKIEFISPKLDFFSRQLMVQGSYAIDYDDQTRTAHPEFDGRIIASDVLLGLNKKPTEPSPLPAWDSFLDPIIDSHYPQGIPENRAFASIDNLNVPLYYDSSRLKSSGGLIDFFGGRLKEDVDWNIRQGPAHFILKTEKVFRMSLLPLGRSKFRQSFEKFAIELEGGGIFRSLKDNDLVSSLSIKLLENIYVPEAGDLSLTAKPKLKNALLSVPDLRIALAGNEILSTAKLDLISKTVDADVHGNNIDTQTVVRLFSTTDIPGTANVRGKISGELKNPRFDLDLSSPGFGYESLFLGTFQGKLSIANQNLSLKGSNSMEGESGSLDLEIGEVFRPSIQTVNLDTKFKNLPAAALLKTKAMTGQISGRFGMKKTGTQYNGDGVITASGILWYGVPIQSATGNLKLNDKRLDIAPISINWGGAPAVRVTDPLVFLFGPDGYSFSGPMFPGATIAGEFKNSDPEHLKMNIKTANASLLFLKPLLPFDITKLTLSSDADILYTLKAPLDSKVTAKITAMEMASEERAIRTEGPAQLSYEKNRILFSPMRLRIGGALLSIEGPLDFKEGSALKLKGDLDLEPLTGLIPPLAESSGRADIDMLMGGGIFKPEFSGKVDFKKATLLIRQMGRRLEDLKGQVDLKGNRLTASGLSGLYDEAPAKADGWVEWSPTGKISAADLKLSGTDIPFAQPDTWRLLANLNVLLRGEAENLTLSGSMNVTEGLYYKDYVFSQFVLKPIGVTEEKNGLIPEPFKNFHLDLDVLSQGDFEVRNNMADLVMNGRLNLKGTMEDPLASGSINVTEGQIHAVGIEFTDAQGFATFVPAKKFRPYVEFTGTEDIQNYEIRVKLQGYIDNLNMALESSPTLSQNEIVSLIVYGRTPDQLVDTQKNLFSSVAVASQLVGLLQRPLSKATKLDIVKLGSEYRPGEGTPVASRLSIGKQLSDRFSLAFTTDLSFQEAFQGITAEYLIFDQLLLKTTKQAGPGFNFDLTWRLEGY